ncbi:AraC family transcriptional regulator of arabinose operon [Pedobacter sp. UYP24]
MENNLLNKKKAIKEGFVGQRMIVLPPNIKRKITTNPLSRHFYLTAIGYYPKAVNHDRIRKSGSNQYILIYCAEGAGKIHLGGETFELYPNTYFIIPKNTPHRYHSSAENPWSIYWLHYMGDLAEVLFERFTENGKPNVQGVPYEEQRLLLFDQIYALLEHGVSEKALEKMNLNLLHFVSSMIYHREANPAVYNIDLTSKSITFMKSNLGKKLEIDDFAKQQCISVSHYSRLFKEKTGSSPINYFNQLKIQKACQHLYFTDKSIKEICVELGFDDQYYFSRLFSKIIGSSPSVYKKRHKR